MSEVVTVFVPLFAFMLLPVWIPMIAAVGGALTDRVRPRKLNLAEQRVQAIRDRVHAQRDAERTGAVVLAHTPRHEVLEEELVAA